MDPVGEGEQGSLADRQATDGDVLWRRADGKADGEGVDPVVAGDCEGEGEREGDERGLWHGGRAGGTGMCVRFVVGVGFWVWTNDHSTLGGLKFSKAINLERYLEVSPNHRKRILILIVNYCLKVGVF